jgi:GTP pyrophosphokinase/guanosine-3',5'-bis(diphosphate) 3'-pyrophosphohydrolase
VVEVVRGPQPIIPPDWRSLTVTGRARSAIRRHIRTTEREEFVRLGRAAIDQAFARAGKDRSGVSLRPALDRFAQVGEEELFEQVGRGRITPIQLVEAVFPGLKLSEREAAAARARIENGRGASLYVSGSGLTPGISLHFAECCSPVPGDRIVGILQTGDEAHDDGPGGSGLTVHTIDCPRLAEFEDQDDLWRDLSWTPQAETNTISRGRLTATIKNAVGVLGQACTLIGEAGGDIANLRMHHRRSDFLDIDFDLDVRDARHLTHIAAALRACPAVEVVERVKG